MNKAETLQINYEEFLAVLKEWDEYTHILLNEMPKKGFDVVFINHGQGGNISATDMEISELVDLLWQSLKSGAKDVEQIHDECFFRQTSQLFQR